MTNLYGTGKNGKRLWIRTNDNRWIEIPYGAGQDSKIRSVNVWNSKLKKWMTPIWGQWIWNLAGSQQQDMDAFDVRLPSRTWRGATTASNTLPFYNPTYINKRGIAPFTGQSPGWIRFFYLRPRVDPNWRIVSLMYRIPNEVPNQTISYDTEYSYFWPAVGVNEHSSYTTFTGEVVQSSESRAFTSREVIYLAQSTASGQATLQQSKNTASSSTQLTAMIDLKAIRERLKDKYSQQGIDFQGQYEPIDYMGIRRIYVNCKISVAISQTGTAPSALNGMSVKLYSNTDILGVAESAIDPNWPDDGPYTVRHPANVIPAGQVFRVIHGDDLTHTSAAIARDPNQDNAGTDGQQFIAQDRIDNLYHDVVFVDPEEDKIAFFCEIEGQPILIPPAVTEWSTSVSVQADRISIHYATNGHDTPESKHSWDAIS